MHITTEIVLAVLAASVGIPAAIALLIDVFKWAGVINEGNAGKASAALNLIALIVVAVLLQFYPRVDVPSADKALLEIVKFATLIFQYILQITISRQTHKLVERTKAYWLAPPKAG